MDRLRPMIWQHEPLLPPHEQERPILRVLEVEMRLDELFVELISRERRESTPVLEVVCFRGAVAVCLEAGEAFFADDLTAVES